MSYDFTHQKEEWARLPIDDVGYFSTDELLGFSPEQFKLWIGNVEQNRYKGWRNVDNKWRDYLGLDTTKNKVVFDFGCGIGIESLQFAHKGNKIILGDINQGSLDVAKRTLEGYESKAVLITDKPPYYPEIKYDIFYANGVLHHLPYFREILQRAVKGLNKGGEIRLMLYSDKAWDLYGEDFVRNMDQVGDYADWYSREKVEKVVGDFLDVYFCDYITDNDRYLVTKMRAKK